MTVKRYVPFDNEVLEVTYEVHFDQYRGAQVFEKVPGSEHVVDVCLNQVDARRSSERLTMKMAYIC